MNINDTETFVIKKKRGFFDMTHREKGVFIAQVFGVFFIIFIALFIAGFAPQEWKLVRNDVVVGPDSAEQVDQEPIAASTSYTRPTRISIPQADIDTVVVLPESQNVSVLDQFLQKGAVHYPGSGSVESGNMFIFGHSTNWSVVRNQAYKTFNGLEKLNPGDEIYVEAGNETYLYTVDRVELVNEDEAIVDLSGTERKLTISTCNSFGQKQERWVAHASFVRQI